jgi:hypothetical protein
VAGRVDEGHGVGQDRALGEDVARGLLVADEVVDVDRAVRARGLDRDPVDDGDLVLDLRVVDDELEQEAVDLRLGEVVGALGLDRVLRPPSRGRARARGTTRRRW